MFLDWFSHPAPTILPMYGSSTWYLPPVAHLRPFARDAIGCSSYIDDRRSKYFNWLFDVGMYQFGHEN